jgi:hypothetical protein
MKGSKQWQVDAIMKNQSCFEATIGEQAGVTNLRQFITVLVKFHLRYSLGSNDLRTALRFSFRRRATFILLISVILPRDAWLPNQTTT